jgi:ankyrin repeat protein
MGNSEREPSPEARARTAKLFDAAKRGDLQMVQELIAEGADVNSLDLEDDYGFPGQDPLDVAADYGHGDIIRELIRAGSNNRAFIVNSISSGQPDAVRAWIELGEDVNAYTDEDRYTPLLAAAGSSLEIVKMLVDAGAKVNYMSPNGRSALDLAMEKGNRAVVDFLRPLCSPKVVSQAERYAKQR